MFNVLDFLPDDNWNDYLSYMANNWAIMLFLCLLLIVMRQRQLSYLATQRTLILYNENCFGQTTLHLGHISEVHYVRLISPDSEILGTVQDQLAGHFIYILLPMSDTKLASNSYWRSQL